MKRLHINKKELRALLQMLKKLNSSQKEELLKYMRQLQEHDAKDGINNKLTHKKQTHK